jgi:hypothetical protein
MRQRFVKPLNSNALKEILFQKYILQTYSTLSHPNITGSNKNCSPNWRKIASGLSLRLLMHILKKNIFTKRKNRNLLASKLRWSYFTKKQVYTILHYYSCSRLGFTSEDEYKWYWHQMIYFPETINTISTLNTIIADTFTCSFSAVHTTYSVHAGILKPWRCLPWLLDVFPFYHVLPVPLSGFNWRSLSPPWGSGPPVPKMAPPFTGSTHTPSLGSGTIPLKARSGNRFLRPGRTTQLK